MTNEDYQAFAAAARDFLIRYAAVTGESIGVGSVGLQTGIRGMALSFFEPDGLVSLQIIPTMRNGQPALVAQMIALSAAEVRAPPTVVSDWLEREQKIVDAELGRIRDQS